MPTDFCFHRHVAEHQLLSIHHGEPIQPFGNGWDYLQLLQLSATAMMAAVGCGPPDPRYSPEELEKLPRKEKARIVRAFRLEMAALQRLFAEISDAVVSPDEYDDTYEDTIIGTAEHDSARRICLVELQADDQTVADALAGDVVEDANDVDDAPGFDEGDPDFWKRPSASDIAATLPSNAKIGEVMAPSSDHAIVNVTVSRGMKVGEEMYRDMEIVVV